jgi:hypothetical protein
MDDCRERINNVVHLKTARDSGPSSGLRLTPTPYLYSSVSSTERFFF